MVDDYGTSYYYRGVVENNYVKFAGFYWRIIRVNGNGSLKIIYDGTTAYANGESSNDRFTKVNQPFNALYDDAKYVGWMYGPANAVSGTTTTSANKAQAQTNTANSDIKTVVDKWYKTNIQDKGYENVIADTLFCNDRTIPGPSVTLRTDDTALGYGKNITMYGGFGRFITGNNGTAVNPRTNIQPTFRCSQKNDRFTVKDTNIGNGALTYPVGLITADEIVAAGSGIYTSTSNFFLYKSKDYYMWTMTPARNYNACIFAAGLNMNIDYHNVSHYLNNKYLGGLAPVINLTPEYASTLVGNGTMSDPYRESGVTPIL